MDFIPKSNIQLFLTGNKEECKIQINFKIKLLCFNQCHIETPAMNLQ